MLQYKKTDIKIWSSPNRFPKPVHMNNKSVKKTIRITISHEPARYGDRVSKSKSSIKEKSSDSWNKPLKSTCFQPIMDYRRTYSNVKYLYQVIQKQVRARSISDKFEASNYRLDMNVKHNQGFRGGKLAEYSSFQKSKYARSTHQSRNLFATQTCPDEEQELEEQEEQEGKQGNGEFTPYDEYKYEQPIVVDKNEVISSGRKKFNTVTHASMTRYRKKHAKKFITDNDV